MARPIKPGLDPRLVPEQGVTKDGQPISYNRAPCSALSPWIARIYASHVEMPKDYEFDCELFSDVAGVHIMVDGHVTAKTRDGKASHSRDVLFFGPHSRAMPLRSAGSVANLGFLLRPGACRVIAGVRLADYVDRLLPLEQTPLCSGRDLRAPFDGLGDAAEAADTLESLLCEMLLGKGIEAPDPVTACFEQITFEEPGISVAEAARRCNVERRRLERTVLRDFGMSPKQVLKRARALDMASQLKKVADEEEGPQIVLRYYDESHLIREFTELFGIPPRQFAARPTPILTQSLELRQARRLEALGRLTPDLPRPWQG